MLNQNEYDALQGLCDKVADVVSDFTMPYDDRLEGYSRESLAYRYACALDNVNSVMSDLATHITVEK